MNFGCHAKVWDLIIWMTPKREWESFLTEIPIPVVAVDNDVVIGVIMCGNDGRRGYIHHTAVSPLFRNQGIGTGLVAAALNELKNIGINKVTLVAFSGNESGNLFWEKRGFIMRALTVNQFEKSKSRRDEKYFCETEEGEHNPKPMPADANKAKRIFRRRTCLFLS